MSAAIVTACGFLAAVGGYCYVFPSRLGSARWKDLAWTKFKCTLTSVLHINATRVVLEVAKLAVIPIQIDQHSHSHSVEGVSILFIASKSLSLLSFCPLNALLKWLYDLGAP